MALMIHETCVNCDMCEPECPNEAIVMGPSIYEILPDKCTECVGYYDEPQCQKVCPITRCVEFDPSHVETREQLLAKLSVLLEAQ